MPRPRNPKRDEAKRIWLESGGQIALKNIAQQLGVSDSQVRNWKVADDWENSGIVAQQNMNRGATKRKPGAPKGNKNAVGNIGGPGGPVGNDKAVTHGFFRRIFPDDPDTHAIINEIEQLDPLDIIWQNIVIQYTAIARAQRIMHVHDATDHSEFVISESIGVDGAESHTRLVQPAWDKHANFLQAQSRAMKTLEGLIARYEELLPGALKAEEKRMRIEKLRAEVDRMRNPDGLIETEDDGFLDALKGRAAEVWSDDAGS